MSLSYTYPKDKTKLYIYNGFWEPTQNETDMKTNWKTTFFDSNAPFTIGHPFTVVNAPAGGSNKAFYIDTAYVSDNSGRIVHQSITPLRGGQFNKNTGFYPLFSPLKWKYRAEFRLRINADNTSDNANYKLSTAFGVLLDGCGYFDLSSTSAGFRSAFGRVYVAFNVQSQLAGITSTEVYTGGFTNSIRQKDLYSTAWAGSYDTWYNMRVEWEYDFYTDPLNVSVTCYVDKALLFSTTVPLNQWRYLETNTHTWKIQRSSYNAFTGRYGIGVCINQGLGTYSGGSTLRAYFEDILFTQDELSVPITWQIKHSLLQTNSEDNARALVIANDTKQLSKGNDIAFHLRNSTSDLWNCIYRGRIREAKRLKKKVIQIECEGYDSQFAVEKVENTTFTAQKPQEIFEGIIGSFDKGSTFDASTFFDTYTTTYTRTYIQVPKIDIFLEMAELSNMILFLDYGLNFHLQKPRTNQSNLHLKYGEDKIINYTMRHVDNRQPNVIRVVGSGVVSERENSNQWFSSATQNIKTIMRLDLTTQTEVDEAVDYYMSLFREEVQILELELKANYAIQVGYIITISISRLNLRNTKFLVLDMEVNETGLMKISLLEANQSLTLLLSDLLKRSSRSEETQFPTDTIANQEIILNKEGQAILLTSATYELSGLTGGATTATGTLLITDEFIDDLIEKWNNESPTQPSHIAIGTGTTEPTYEDTTLVTESSRAAAALSYKDEIANYTSRSYYRSVEYEITVVGSASVAEIGLLNAGAAGTLACRAAFATRTYTNLNVKIRLSFDIAPNTTFVTYRGIKAMTDWLYAGTWTTLVHIHGISIESHTGGMPHPMLSNASDLYQTNFKNFRWLADPSIDPGTYAVNKITGRDEIKFRDYRLTNTTLDFNQVYVGFALTDALSDFDDLKEWWIVSFTPIAKQTELQWDFKIWLKILRSEVVY
jgi:hypothetical protein